MKSSLRHRSPLLSRTIVGTLLLAGGFFLHWSLHRGPTVETSEAQAHIVGNSTPESLLSERSLQPDAQKVFAPVSTAEELELRAQLKGEGRPPQHVRRGAHQRRVFDDPVVRVVEPQQSEALHLFTGRMPLRLNEQVPDHHQSVSALALGFSHVAFSHLAAAEAPRIVIPLEENLSVTFRVNKIITRGPMTHSYFGTIEEHPESIAQLVYNDGAVTGHFVLYSDDTHPTRHYEIKYLTEDLVAMHTLDETAFLAHPCGTCAAASELAPEDAEREDDLVPVASVPENYASNGRVVDVVVGYSPEARQADGGVANIEARIVAAVDRMNQAFENSCVNGRLVLLGMIEDPAYVEADYSMSQALYALNAGWHPTIANPMQTLRAFRLELGADFAHFVMNQAEYGGLAYITNWSSVTRRDQITTARFSLEHEVGHNLGALHAWGDTSTDLTKDHARYGWRFRRADGSSKRRTIMAYDWNWSYVLHFSNPNISYNINGEMVKTGAVPGYNASGDPTVDPKLVSGGAIGGQGSGYNGTNPELGSDVAGWFNEGTNSGIARAATRYARATLAITDPRAGDTLNAWEIRPIEWIGGTWQSPLRLELYQGVTKVADIGTLPQNGNRFYAWTPGPGLSGSDFRIRVILNGGQPHEESAFSGTFAIEAPVIPEYPVTYHANGAGGTVPTQATKYHNVPLTLAGAGGLGLPGQTFVGWNTQADGSGLAYPPGDVYTLNESLTLHAQWVAGYTLAIDFGKPGQETAGHWNNITGSGEWAEDLLLSPALLRTADGGQSGVRLRAQRVASAGRAGIGGLDIASANQDATASFTVSGTIPASAQRDIAYTSDTGAVQFVFENLDDSMKYRLEFQTLHTSATAAGLWIVQPGTAHEQSRLVSRNKGAAAYSPAQVFANLQTDGTGRIVLRSAGNVAQNINAMELTAMFPSAPQDPAQPENPGGGTGVTYILDAVNGNDSSSGLSEALAWKTFQKAINTLQPGDTVLIREGDYMSTGNDEYKNWSIATSGTPGQTITYRAYPGERPRLHVDTWNGLQLWNVSHIELDGLEVVGLPDPAGLENEPDNSQARKDLAQDRRYFGGGITVTHNGTEPHHIRIRNCVVRQVGGNGIAFRGGNMILVEGNTVHSSTHRSDAGNSAISFVELNSNIHISSGYGVVVRNNTLHNNRNRVAFKYVGYITDGNGLIIDYCQNYTGDRVLIANNLAYNNGGRGFHVYNGKNVDIVHNTAYQNLASPDLQWAGELSSDAPSGQTNDSVTFHNNIAVARADRRAYHIANTTNAAFTRNVTQSPRAVATTVDGAQNKLNTDPLFVNPAGLDFRLQTGSPAIDYGLVFDEVPADALGNTRQGAAPDLGAFEFTGTANTPPTLSISSPSNNDTFTQGNTVTLIGSASDAEDGDLSASAAWTSSIDGALGTGGTLSLTTLSAGTHTLTFSVIDSGGLSASDSITLNLQAPSGIGVLARYTFAAVPAIGTQHSSSTFVRQAAAETVAAGITASPFVIRNDAANAARIIATDTANGISGAAQIAGIQSNLFQWQSGASVNPYFEFTLEGANALETLHIVARSGVQWNNSGVFLAYDANRRAEISVRSSLDNFASNIGTVFIGGTAGAFAEQILDLSGLNPGGQSVTFRIYTRATLSSDNWHRVQVDRVEVTGTAATTPQDLYNLWALDNGIAGAATDTIDGVPNLLRYALGGNASTPASTFRLLPTRSGTGMTLNFPRIDDAALIYEVWAADQLPDWEKVWEGQGVGPGEVWVPAAGNLLFLHLRVRRE